MTSLLWSVAIRLHLYMYVLGRAQTENTRLSLSNEAVYVCELYKHSQAKLGKFLVFTHEVTRYVERPRIFVYTSCVDTTQTAASVPMKRPQSSDVHVAIEELSQKHTRRKNGRESWLDSRVGRITGTSAAFVMTGKTVTGSGMKQMFGLLVFQPTVQMKIGTILEPKILDTYCKGHNLTLNTPKGLVVSDKNYIGHTPDGIISYPHREVLEVKVIFSKRSVQSVLHKHIHQLQQELMTRINDKELMRQELMTK